MSRVDRRAGRTSRRVLMVVAQQVCWLVGRLLRVRFAVSVEVPPGLFERRSERCLIIAPTHQSYADPWLLAGALTQRQCRALLPVRTLATMRFDRLRPLTPMIRALYWLVGAVPLPPTPDGGSVPRKVRGLLRALERGDPVAIFPEGRVRRNGEPPIGQFAPGVVYLHRVSQAPVVPIAVWLGDPRRVRRRYRVKVGPPLRIPETLDLVSAAVWLREQTLRLYAAAEHVK